MTVAPRNNSDIEIIPRSSPSIVPTNPSGPTIRNYTTAYTTGLSSAYIGLYAVISLLGAEGITIGVLFGIGILVIKKKAVAAADDEQRRRLKAQATEYEVNSSAVGLLENLNLNGSQPIVIIKLEWSK